MISTSKISGFLHQGIEKVILRQAPKVISNAGPTIRANLRRRLRLWESYSGGIEVVSLKDISDSKSIAPQPPRAARAANGTTSMPDSWFSASIARATSSAVNLANI